MNIGVYLSKHGKGDSGRLFIEKLRRAHGGSGTVATLYYEDVIVSIKGSKLNVLHSTTDFLPDIVYLRGKGYPELRHVLALYYHSQGAKLVNSESLTFQYVTKLEQNAGFALAGVAVPDSVYVSDMALLPRAVDILGGSFPIVAKAIDGSNGNDNVLAQSMDDLLAHASRTTILQAYQPNSFDYRVIVVGDQVIASYKRIRDMSNLENYKNNIGQGGVREFIELDDELKSMAVRAASSIGREFTGVDILPNEETGQHVVLEANFNFGTPEFEDQETERRYYEAILGYFKSL